MNPQAIDNAVRDRHRARSSSVPGRTIAARIAGLDWARIEDELDRFGCPLTGAVLAADECAALAGTRHTAGIIFHDAA